MAGLGPGQPDATKTPQNPSFFHRFGNKRSIEVDEPQIQSRR
jgi:hypothetical protein